MLRTRPKEGGTKGVRRMRAPAHLDHARRAISSQFWSDSFFVGRHVQSARVQRFFPGGYVRFGQPQQRGALKQREVRLVPSRVFLCAVTRAFLPVSARRTRKTRQEKYILEECSRNAFRLLTRPSEFGKKKAVRSILSGVADVNHSFFYDCPIDDSRSMAKEQMEAS